MIRHYNPIWARLGTLLTAFALVVRLLAPTGFMPVAGPAGFTIALCSGAGNQTITLPDGDHPRPMTDGGCAFASLAPTAAIAHVVAVAPPPLAVPAPRPAKPRGTALAIGPPPPTPPATGPPIRI